MEGGRPVGAAARFYLDEGSAEVDCYEPSPIGKREGTWQWLNFNLEDFRNVRLHNKALWTSKGKVSFDDLDSAPAGASRSSVSEMNIYKRGKNKKGEPALVDATPLSEELKNHTVVKLDIEGGEMPILKHVQQWRQVRLLVFEFSTKRCRERNLGYQPFAEILEALEKGGFSHVDVPGAMWKPKHFTKQCYTKGLDDAIFCYRVSGLLGL